MKSARFLRFMPFCVFALLQWTASGQSVTTLPLVIEKNQGQARADVRYLTSYGPLHALFTRDGVEFTRSGGGQEEARAMLQLGIVYK